MKSDLGILVMAGASLALGLSLFLWIATKRDRHEYFTSANVISWLLIALFPVLVIFSLFPTSTFDARIGRASMTGAIAAFAWIWWYGTRSGLRAAIIDEHKEKLQKLHSELARLKAVPSGGTSQSRKLQPDASRSYRVKGSAATVTLFTGSIDQLKTAEIWVSSENTNMQMARFYERSVSGTIRYLGSRKDFRNEVIEDTIADQLATQMGPHRTVEPKTVLATGAGALTESHGVRQILHVAAVKGQVAFGYQPVENIEGCVTAALCRADKLTLEPPCRSIVLPLFGTGTARGALEPIVQCIISAIIRHIVHEPTKLQHVYILAWYEHEFEICRGVLEGMSAVRPCL